LSKGAPVAKVHSEYSSRQAPEISWMDAQTQTFRDGWHEDVIPPASPTSGGWSHKYRQINI